MNDYGYGESLPFAVNFCGGVANERDAGPGRAMDGLSTDARPSAPPVAEDASPDELRKLLAEERATHAETSQDLAVERAAHDETAEKMVQLQQRLEVTLQELANLERFTKSQQQTAKPRGASVTVERLTKEEAYLVSRLSFVQKELAEKAGGDVGMSI